MITKPDKLTIQTDDLDQIKLLCSLAANKFFALLGKHWLVQDYVTDSYPGKYRGTFNLMAVMEIQPDPPALPVPEVWVSRALLLRIQKHFQEGDPSKSGRFSHLNPDEIAEILVAECKQAYDSGEQIYRDICEVLKS